MSFVIKHRHLPGQTMTADYECPEHGRFELLVERNENGDPPAEIDCPIACDHEHHCEEPPCGDCGFTVYECGRRAEWRISAPATRVRKVEAIKGGWAKPQRPTWLDTRELGEGQSLEEFREKRAAIREEQRKREVMRFAREHHSSVIGGD